MDYILVDDDEHYNFFKLIKLPESITLTKDYKSILDPNSELYPITKNCKILIVGRSVYDALVNLHKTGVTHFGLRSFDYGSIKRLSHLTIDDCKIIVADHASVNLKSPNNIKKYKYFLSLPSDYKSEYVLNEFHVVTCDDGMEWLNKFGDEELGFDFESKGFPEDAFFEPVGIGVANDKMGVYVDFRYYSSEEVRKRFFDNFQIWVRNHQYKLWVYYCSFEFNALRRMYHEFFKICDCMSLLKCYNEVGNLKLMAQNWLHITSWDDLQDLLNERAAGVFNKFKTYEDYVDAVNNPDKYDEEHIKHRDKMTSLIKDYNYDPKILKKYWGYEFAVTAKDIIGKYCILDAYYTLQIAMKINKEYDFIGTR